MAVSGYLALSIVSCSSIEQPRDTDVIVVGAGIAGLSAALEASDNGARVLVFDANSVGGGHAVKAGGFALVDTALQRDKGIQDSPNLAYRDLFRWGEDPDPYWTRFYVENSAAEVYDWLTEIGVQFKLVLNTPESSVARFHFTRGTAINAVVPLLRKALLDPDIQFVWNTRVTALVKVQDRIAGVYTTNERNGVKQEWRAPTTVLATGGFQNNLNMVREYWPDDQKVPKQIFSGAGRFATGDGHRMAEWAGADMRNMERQVTFYGGVPNPRAPASGKALYSENPAAIWLAANGRRFTNEAADEKITGAAIRELDSESYWLIFDSRGSRRLMVRDALLANRNTIRDDILNNPALAAQADDLGTLAKKAGLPEHGLRTSIETWNRMVALGTDYQFGRFNPKETAANVRKIKEPPFYAVRVYPLTRKNLGGVAITVDGQVTDTSGKAIPGLFAAGELTGVAGINGSYGGAGTFLGPSVLTGRIAGRTAAETSIQNSAGRLYNEFDSALEKNQRTAPAFGLPGYWHYDQVHQLASEQAYTCDRCHANSSTMATAYDTNEMLLRLNTCTGCH